MQTAYFNCRFPPMTATFLGSLIPDFLPPLLRQANTKKRPGVVILSQLKSPLRWSPTPLAHGYQESAAVSAAGIQGPETVKKTPTSGKNLSRNILPKTPLWSNRLDE